MSERAVGSLPGYMGFMALFLVVSFVSSALEFAGQQSKGSKMVLAVTLSTKISFKAENLVPFLLYPVT